MCPSWEWITNISRLDHWSIALLIISRLTDQVPAAVQNLFQMVNVDDLLLLHQLLNSAPNWIIHRFRSGELGGSIKSGTFVCRRVSWLEFNVPFQHKYGYRYIRYKTSGVESYPYPVKEGHQYINLNSGRLLFVLTCAMAQRPPGTWNRCQRVDKYLAINNSLGHYHSNMHCLL